MPIFMKDRTTSKATVAITPGKKNIQNIQIIQVVMKVPGSIPGGRLITSTSAPATGTAISPLG
jgi:hypothetical protein